jgi:hypothetical protein
MGLWKSPRDTLLNLIQYLVKARLEPVVTWENGLKEAPLVYKIQIPQLGKGNFEGSTGLE